MNRDIFRLVFNTSLGIQIPASEHARRSSRAAGGRALRRMAALLAGAFGPFAMAAAPLPQVSDVNAFVGRGAANMPVLSADGRTLTVQQTSGAATVLNWANFDIASGHTVNFVQPDVTSRVVNLVDSSGPRSEIFGNLNANGQVFLFNQAGILFGPGAMVDVGGLVASTLKMNETLIDRALSSTLQQGQAAFSEHVITDPVTGQLLPTGAIDIGEGARIMVGANGRVLFAAPDIRNAGTVVAPQGQVLFAAGKSVYLTDTTDARLRGIVVEVDGGGQITNEQAGQLLAQRGNITLAGLNISQQGSVRTSSTVTLNGSIIIDANSRTEGRGEVRLGGGSVTAVDVESGDATVRDDVTFQKSFITVEGRRVILEDAQAGEAGAHVLAHGGDISVSAQAGVDYSVRSVADAASRIYLGKGSVIDVSGLRNVEAASQRHIVQVELRGDEFKDAPLQRSLGEDGLPNQPLYGTRIWVDLRDGIEPGDGRQPFADVSAYVPSIQRTVQEKSTASGNISLRSEGDLIAHAESRLDVSGGSVLNSGGITQYTLLQTAQGSWIRASTAAADQRYIASQNRTQVEAAYVEGKDAGTLTVQGHGLALDGRIDGQVVQGTRQRDVDDRPQGGRLVIGANSELSFLTPDVLLSNVRPDRSWSESSATPQSFWLASELFGTRGFSRLQLYSGGLVTIQGNPVTLQPGGSFEVVAREIDVLSDITTASGSIVLTTTQVPNDAFALDPARHDIQVADGVTISTAGNWVNDLRRPPSVGDASAIASNGGEIVLRSVSNLHLGRASVIDVSAGGSVSTSGRTAFGDAGRVTLSTGRLGLVELNAQTSRLVLAGQLRGYGVSDVAGLLSGRQGSGGTLTLSTSALRIGSGLADASTDSSGRLSLDDSFLSQGGFSSFDLTGVDGVVVEQGSSITPQVAVVNLGLNARSLTSRNDLRGSESLAVPEPEVATPFQLELRASNRFAGDLLIERDALIDVGQRGSLTLAGERLLSVEGALRARGGRIELEQVSSISGQAYDATRKIYIGADARLDVSGAFRRAPDPLFRTGEVLSGGTISIVSDRGYIVAQQGARLLADGASESGLQLSSLADGRRAPVTVDSDGGNIILRAREGLLFDATVSARAGGTQAQGGSFSADLSRVSGQWEGAGDVINAERSLELSQNAASSDPEIGAGSALSSDRFLATGRLSADRLMSGGFANVKLASEGNLVFDGAVDLSLSGVLSLDAASLGAGAGDVRLSSYLLQLSNLKDGFAGIVAPTSAQSRFSGKAHFIDVKGDVTFRDFALVTLDSDRDIRLSGVVQDVDLSSQVTDNRLAGSLVSANDLTLGAQQIYATTQSEFAVELRNTSTGTLSIEQNAGPAGAVLAAAAKLDLVAPRIVQAGTLRSPFGSISLTSARVDHDGFRGTRSAVDGSITLTDGSVTSVSAQGRTVLYGSTTQAGQVYQYDIGGRTFTIDQLPQRAVNLSGASLDVQAGAQIDLSAGGDLQSSEFIVGPGGSTDILLASSSPDTYAVLPGLDVPVSPEDAQTALGSTQPLAGQSIRLDVAAGGLPAGTYRLLPARFALLAGAFLVKLDRTSLDAPTDRANASPDGVVSVGARLLNDALGSADQLVSTASSRSFAVQILDGAQVRARSEYLETRASEFFADAGGQGSGDAGRVSLVATRSIALEGLIAASHTADGRGAQVDISATRLEVLGEGESQRDATAVRIDVAALSRLGAESLLLGGLRAETTDATSITTGAQSVLISTGGQLLEAPELLAVAADTLTVASGSRLSASTSSAAGLAPKLSISGTGAAADGALLRLSGGEQAQLRRDQPLGARGTLTIEAGVEASGRSVILDGTLNTRLNGEVTLDDTSGRTALTVGATLISLGDTPDDLATGIVLNDERLAQLGSPAQLELKSYSTVDLYGDVSPDWQGVTALVIDAQGLRGLSGASGAPVSASLAAQSLTLRNSTGTSLSTPGVAATGSALELKVGTLNLGDTGWNTFLTSGFAQVRVDAGGDVVATGTGRHEYAADLTISAPRIVADQGSNQAVNASGDLQLLAGNRAGAAPAEVPLAGKLALSGDRVTVATEVLAPSGRLDIRATGDGADDGVTLTDAARVSAAGSVRALGGATYAVSAGEVVLASERGNVTAEAGAVVDVSAVGGGDAGLVRLIADAGQVSVAGTLKGSAATQTAMPPAKQGRIDIRASEFGDTSASLTGWLAASGEFAESVSLAVASGDFDLASGTRVSARHIELLTNDGSIRLADRAATDIAGVVLDASGPSGGSIRLFADNGSRAGSGVVYVGRGALLDVSAERIALDANGAQIDDASVRVGADAGRIEIGVSENSGATPTTRIEVAEGAQFDLRAASRYAADGSLLLRAPRTSDDTATRIAAFDGVVLTQANDKAEGVKAAGVTIEGVRRYNLSDISLATIAATSSPVFQSSLTFTSSAAAQLAALGLDNQPFTASVRAGVEVLAPGDIVLSQDLNFRTASQAGVLGTLTLRAAGDIRLNASLSDGFSTATTAGLLANAESWNYRLVAGADAAAADPLSIAMTTPEGSGNLILSAARFVRTGTGSIDIATAGDIQLADRAVIYTAGRADTPGAEFQFSSNINVSGSSRQAEYGYGGGDIRIAAGGDIQATGTSQLVNQWLFRSGRADNGVIFGSATTASGARRNPTWWVRYDQFQQGIGTLGGGDIDVEAGGNVTNLGLVAATNGRLFGAAGSAADPANLKVQGGGNIDLRVAGDLLGGVLYSGRGDLDVAVQGGIGAALRADGASASPFVALGEGNANLAALGSISVQGIGNPTLMDQPASGFAGDRANRFSTYARNGAFEAMSLGGGVTLRATTQSDAAGGGNLYGFVSLGTEERVLPPTLRLLAFGGELAVGGNTRPDGDRLVLLPSASADLQLAARDDLKLFLTLYMSDISPDLLPTAVRPLASLSTATAGVWQNLTDIAKQGADAHDPALLAARSSVPVVVSSDRGSIYGPGVPDITSDSATATVSNALILPKAVSISAGRNIDNIALRVQHSGPGDVSKITAGGDISLRTVAGEATQGVIIGGEGRVQIIAGGDLELGNSFGVVTQGNAGNPYLPERGAAIDIQVGSTFADLESAMALLRDGAVIFDGTLLAALNGKGGGYSSIEDALDANPELAALRTRERADIDARLAVLDQRLAEVARQRYNRPELSDDAALALIAVQTEAERTAIHADARPAALSALNAAIRFGGRLGDRLGAGKDGFAPLYALNEALFPTSSEGSVNLFASQLRTEQGGDINILAPGGGVNVGVPGGSTDPARVSQQGVFAIGRGEINAFVSNDFQVGPSRVFTLGGDDIQITSLFGDVDAGKGAKTAVATPPPQVKVRGDTIVLDISNSVSGSGIATLKGSPDARDATVRLTAPNGAVNAGDAGVRASGNVEIAAQVVIGLNNISAGGSVSGSSTVSSSAPTFAAPSTNTGNESRNVSDRGVAAADGAGSTDRSSNSILTVELVGLGEDPTATGCDDDSKDEACKERATRAN